MVIYLVVLMKMRRRYYDWMILVMVGEMIESITWRLKKICMI